MIDSGCSHANIRAFAQSLTDRPVRNVVNTHSHFDHTGGNGYFERVFITEPASKSAKTVMDDVPANFPLDYAFTFIRDGEMIALGGRPLRVIALDCHSPGSIALLDEKARLLFCGDEVDAGQVLLLPGYAETAGQIHTAPASSVEDCLRSMEKMGSFGTHYDTLYPAHNGAPLNPVYLQWFSELCRSILGGLKGTRDCASRSYHPTDSHYPFPGTDYRRAQHKGAALVYNQRLLWQSDQANAAALPPVTLLHLLCAGVTPDAVAVEEDTL